MPPVLEISYSSESTQGTYVWYNIKRCFLLEELMMVKGR